MREDPIRIVADLPFQLLQMTDSACPTGGFAHSYGVEELLSSGAVATADGLLAALTAYVRESLPGRELAFVALAWDAGRGGGCTHPEPDLASLRRLAHHHVATRLTRTTRDSEQQRGRALRRALDAMVGPAPAWEAAAASYAVLFGAAGALFGADRRSVVRAVAFAQASAMTQAAVRLGHIGPLAAQEILGRLADPLASAVADSEQRRFGDWFGFAPRWELAQARHEHHPSRMFVT